MSSATPLADEESFAVPRRFFCVWDFMSSHAQLLIRSRKDESFPATVDVIFRGVAFVQIPTWLMDGLTIRKASSAETRKVVEFVGVKYAEYADRLYTLESGDVRGFVAARSVEVRETDLEASQTSLDINYEAAPDQYNSRLIFQMDAEDRVPGKLTDLLT